MKVYGARIVGTAVRGGAEDEMEIPEEELSGEEVTDIRTFLQEEG